jgi:mitochondrial fission protein ELM1
LRTEPPTLAEPARDAAAERPLAGLGGWVVTDGKAGMDTQAVGLAEALGLAYRLEHVAPRGLYRVAAPWGPVARSERVGAPGSRFGPPWPAVAIATGRQAIPYIRAIRRRAGLATYTIVLQDPRTGPATADLIWVPAHDNRRGANVFTTPTAPHGFTPARLAALAAEPPAFITALPRPRIAVVLGGKNDVYRFTEEDDARFGRALAALARHGASFLVTPSRRTHKRLLDTVLAATAEAPRWVWDGQGANPYPHFLANADRFVVTADSVNMTGEPCVTGRPVHVFAPSGGSPKFTRFHEALARHGATRPLGETIDHLDEWTYTPLDSARLIAAEVERRWLARRAMLGAPESAPRPNEDTP